MKVQHVIEAGLALKPSVPYSVRTGVAIATMVSLAGLITPTQSLAQELQEIVVTAERRSTNVQSVPIAITAISGEELAEKNQTDYLTILQDVPGVNVRATVNGASITIRGVNSQGGGGELDPKLSTSIDDIYTPFGNAFYLSSFDIERVEVLRGPQGTIYGRNANAGAMNIITKSPELGETSGFFTLRAGSYDAKSLTGALNLPIGESVAVRGALDVRKRDGYTSNGANDEEVLTGRIKALWQASDDISMEFSYEKAVSNGIGSGGVTFPFNGDPYDDNTLTGYQDVKQQGYYAKLNWNLDFADLSLIAAHKENDQIRASDLGGSFITSTNLAELSTFEVRLSSNSDGALTWTAGAFYLDQDSTVGLNIPVPLPPFIPITLVADTVSPVNTESLAFFAQGTYSLTNTLRLTLGARYTDETKTLYNESFTHVTPFALAFLAFSPPPPAPPAPFTCEATSPIGPNTCSVLFTKSGKPDWQKVTGKIGLEYDITDSSMLYGGVSNGFSSGGIYPGSGVLTGGKTTFDAEEILAYEVGSKNRLWDNRAQINASVYYYDYTDMHAGFVTADPGYGGATLRALTNAGNSTIKGAELEMVYQISDADQVSTNIAYTDGKYGDFIFNTTDLTGEDFGIPFTVNTKYSHEFMFDSGASMRGEISARYTDSYYLGADRTDPASKEGSVVIWDLYLNFLPADSDFRIGAYIRNASDEVVRTSYSPASPPQIPTGQAWLQAPRTYGVDFTKNF